MIELLELSQVLDAVRSTGTEVRYYDERCSTHRVAGFYTLGPNVDRLVVCSSNQLNNSDLFDTIRHEAIHVVQACNAGQPVLAYDYLLENTTEEIKNSVFSQYPEDHHHHELEAFTAAEFLSEDEVVELINKFCFE